ncbi:hypothetical protein FCG40_05380 [Fimbriimonadia bacterium ATM]|nr:MAG: hypothetical protein EDM73_09200 [Armatimonadota bacterium]MBC6969042.1 hypothetical protein [Armatimonadota bacterium]MCE7900515.1 hypothetical protein [Armatimonadetes bacterium ATM1]MDL1928403.1 hypothetical protein [Fimbriimonadia bacterium ATM]RIJ94971.1 MAG: hypothetical protein DCC45_11640 [Armatimonadota bacterium]
MNTEDSPKRLIYRFFGRLGFDGLDRHLDGCYDLSTTSAGALEAAALELVRALYADRLEEVVSRLVPRMTPTMPEMGQGSREAEPGAVGQADPSRAGDGRAEILVGTGTRDLWLEQYQLTLTAYLVGRMSEDLEVCSFREKYSDRLAKLASARRGVVGTWEYLLELIEESRPYEDRGGKPTDRLYLHLGPGMEYLELPEQPTEELRDLVLVIESLSAKFRVDPAMALFAVLWEDQRVMHRPYRVWPLTGEPAVRRILLELDPNLPPDLVRTIYDRSRAKLGLKKKTLSRKALELARIAVENPDLSWGMLIRSWEHGSSDWMKHPDRKRYLPKGVRSLDEIPSDESLDEVEDYYRDYYRRYNNARRNFIRDVNRAWRTVFDSHPPKRKMTGEKSKRIAE